MEYDNLDYEEGEPSISIPEKFYLTVMLDASDEEWEEFLDKADKKITSPVEEALKEAEDHLKHFNATQEFKIKAKKPWMAASLPSLDASDEDHLKHYNAALKKGYNGALVIRDLQKAIPAINTQVDFPCHCTKDLNGKISNIISIISHLNDSPLGSPCHYNPDQIADWLETLDIDLTFSDKEEQNG